MNFHRGLKHFSFRLWLLTLCAALAAPASLLADHGRFLPDANPGSATDLVHTYGRTNPLQLNGAVTDTAKNINAGNIRFDYDTYTRNATGAVQGGAALSGGFFPNPDVRLKPNYELIWVQAVAAIRTGTEARDSWNLPSTGAGWYPDADPNNRPPPNFGPDDPKYAPSYPFTNPAANNTGQNPSIPGQTFPTGFQDFPGRFFADGNQTWRAELALACVSKTQTTTVGGMPAYDVRVISSFLWGFELTGLPANPPPPGINNVSSFGPALWSDATDNFIMTMNDFYDGLGGGGGTANGGAGVASTRYSFQKNSNCFTLVPEPATLLLLVFSAALIRRRREARDAA